MRNLLSIIERVANSDSSVLITGATGTGKELVARTIHKESARRSGPFVDINCSAIPESLVEAELFGHQRGTFTGAHENRRGLFEAASGGTLFLDEIDSLDLAAQAKLLRVLQERSVRRIGGRERIAVDVRIISATNCDLSRAVSDGRFRSDLLYRLRVVPIHVPELYRREGDIEMLAEHFLALHSERCHTNATSFSHEALNALCEYSWPGNVRELENTIEYALTIGCDDEIKLEDLPPEVVEGVGGVDADSDRFNQLLDAYIHGKVTLAEVERRYILSVLEHYGGNQVRTAAALGINRSKLGRRLKQYGVRAVKFLQEEDGDGLQLRGY